MSAVHAQRGPALLASAALLVLATHFASGPLLRPLARPFGYSDFATFYSAARCFAEGRDPYDIANLHAAGAASFGGWIGRYFYPPPFAAVCVRPLALLPFETARRLWVLLEAAAYLAALVLLASGLLRGRGPVPLAGMAVLGLPYAPVALDLKLGSVSGVLLLLLALFVRARGRRQANRAALALAAAVLLKLTPALLLPYLVLRGETRFVLRTLACAALLVLGCLPWTGLRPYVDYAGHVLPFLTSANFSWFTNQSLDAFFWRLFVPNPDTTPWLASTLLYHAATWSAYAAVIAALALLARRARRGEIEEEAWEIACVLVASLLLARVTWEFMLVLALPAFALWWRRLLQPGTGRVAAGLAALAYAACALPFPYTEAPLRSGSGLLLEAPRTYGLVLLFALSMQEVLRRVRPPTAPELGPVSSP